MLLTHLSLTGVRFATYLNFPVSNTYLVQLLLTFGEWEFSLIGRISACSKSDNLQHYECRLEQDEAIENAIARAMLDLVIDSNPLDKRLHALMHRLNN